MAAHPPQSFRPTVVPRAAIPFNPAAAIPASGAPPGTFAPGTKVQVGSHRVVIEKYLSEGGFAHVYVVRLPKPVEGVEQAVLKRVAVPDKDHLANMRTEVETMKKLKGHRYIVKYFDSHASQLKGGGYEVFLLMEYCSGGGLIDFMNTRLQNRLTEPEILHIFSDVAEGVATMHYLRPPLLHRDLKVENVLISSSKSARIYKVCDFGSTAPPRPAATTAAEGRLIEDDVQRHTTLQYRSPEMIDVYRKQPIDEKSDIWALGVLLYKLCYYTTPFEEVGQMAILNATFKFPNYPHFSDRLKILIASMLRENPQKRPNIYEVLRDVCTMRGKDVPVKDIYSNRTASEVRRNQQLPPSPTDERPRVGAAISPPTKEIPIIPDIAPMRRGRPTASSSHHTSAKPSPSPLRFISQTDPFAALDGNKPKGADELSARFPKLDEFSLLQDSTNKFEFDSSNDVQPPSRDLSQRVTMALADDAFARAPAPTKPVGKPSNEAVESVERSMTVAEQTKSMESKAAPPKPAAVIAQPTPKRSTMVSTGTMTSPSPPITSEAKFDKRPIHRFPPAELQRRPSSQPWADRIPMMRGSSFSKRSNPNLPSMSHAMEPEPRSPASSRPSLEVSRPTAVDLEPDFRRSKSINSRRPKSTMVPPKMDFLRSPSPERHLPNMPAKGELPDVLLPDTENNITSDIDFLRVKEEEENERKRDKRLSSGSLHMKRSSLPAISLSGSISGTKNLLAGRFGEAFRKFEGGNSGQRSRSPSPQRDPLMVLTPIAGSEATDERSDDGLAIDETEDVSPEMRREMERRRLSMEEKRVANAAAEWRKRVTAKSAGGGGIGGGGGPTRAFSIQNKVQSLLKENERPAIKSATGYGRFTDSGTAVPQVQQFESASRPKQQPLPLVERKPIGSGANLRKVVSNESRETKYSSMPDPRTTAASSTPNIAIPTGQRPQAPPKPKTLQTGPGQILAGQGGQNTDSPNDDWETNFSKKYPSLQGLQGISGVPMVETEIDPPLRTKEV